MVKTLHLISWNINRGSTLQAKLEAILSCNPDLITLQEVTQEAVTYIKQNLKGYFITDTLNGNSRGCDSRFWDDAERNIFSGLSNFDLTDIYRLVNGYDNVRDFSYYAGGNGRRYDHIIASRSLCVATSGTYIRFEKLS